MRALVQGMDPQDCWSRYLAFESERYDRRLVHRTISWIRDEFAAAARRHQRHGMARLVLLDAHTVRERVHKLPSLEDFVAERGMEGFSETEQLEAYQDAFGSQTRSESRRARLIRRQLEALHWLEHQVAAPPRAADPLHDWIAPTLARRLSQAGILTIRQLGERMNGGGRNWSRAIRGLGLGKATRLVEWMRQHAATTGVVVHPHVDRKRTHVAPAELARLVTPGLALVPIDKLQLPLALDGSAGANRGARASCRLDANDDKAAILAWLYAKLERGTGQGDGQSRADAPTTLTHTQRAYLREAERLLLWSVLERNLPLSSLTVSDCQDYLTFVQDPQPRERWCAPRSRGRWSPLWRPFEGPLSPAAQRQARVILGNLFCYLHTHGYLASNPWEGAVVTVPQQPNPAAPGGGRRAVVDFPSWQQDESSAGVRRQIAAELMRITGLGAAAIVRITLGQLRRVDPLAEPGQGTDTKWNLEVTRRNRTARWPLPPGLVSAMSSYLVSRGILEDLDHPDLRNTYLLGRVNDLDTRAPWAKHVIGMADRHAGISASTLLKDLGRHLPVRALAHDDMP